MSARSRVLILSGLAGIAVWVIDAALDAAVFHGGPFLDLLVLRAPPHEVYVRCVSLAAFLAFGGIVAWHLTRRERAEKRAHHLNAILRAVRNVNQLIAREPRRDRLIQEACRELADSRQYHSAWIGLVDEAGQFQAAGQAGLDGVFDGLKESLRAGHRPPCWDGARQAGGLFVVDDPARMCQGCPLIDAYPGFGALCVPLTHGQRLFGFAAVSVAPMVFGSL